MATCSAPNILIILKHLETIQIDDALLIILTASCSSAIFFCTYKSHPKTTIFSMTILMIMAIIDFNFICFYGSTIDVNALSVLKETNVAEFSDFTTSLPLPLILAVIAILLASSLAILFSPPPQKKPSFRILIYCLTPWILSTIILLSGKEIYFKQIATAGQFPEQKNDESLSIRQAFPAGLLWVGFDYAQERKALKLSNDLNLKYKFRESPTEDDTPKIFVLVIGESSRADHWEINGYPRETTPFLSKRTDVISFQRMHTYWTFTRMAVPTMLTRKPPTSELSYFKEASIVTAFKQAGFHTAWISLQAPLGFHDSPISTYAYEADESYFLNPVDYRFHGKKDGDAEARLKAIISQNKTTNLFIVIHTLGSHFRYTDRYPASFAKFMPDEPDGRQSKLFNPPDKKFLVNAYDNSILYTDSVLNDIINILSNEKSRESWMIYCSDHGEALFDNNRNLSGHGEKLRSTQWPASIFWASPRYINSHEDMYQNMRNHEKSLASNAMLFETMSDLGDLHVEGNRPQNSLARSDLRIPVEVKNTETIP